MNFINLEKINGESKDLLFKKDDTKEYKKVSNKDYLSHRVEDMEQWTSVQKPLFLKYFGDLFSDNGIHYQSNMSNK